MKSRAECLNEASEWLLRLQDPGRTETELDDWLRWCDEDPGNYAAFETVQRRWRDLDALKPTLGQMVVTGKGRTRTPLPRFLPWSLAAGLGALALAIGIFRGSWNDAETAPKQIVAELTSRSTTLPDGSRMILGTQSQVNMDFNHAARQLDLSAGKAYFQVKKDPRRPFVVQAGELSVTAIGTAFDVRRERGKIIVTVEEGAVQVASHTPGRTPAIWRAEAGYQVTYSTEDRTASIASVNPATALTWRRGELAYLHETLGVVVEDLNRYSTRKIVIEDPAVAQLTYTGTAFAAELDGWIKGIEQAYPVVVEEADTGGITLRARR